jgi:microcystin-dependent protein
MANYEATRYDFDGANLTGIEGTATGTILPWSSTSLPAGFLECNGQSVSTSTYAALFAVIAYTYGGSGASFNVPNLSDNVAVGKSNNKALGTAGGANTVTPTGNISGNVAGSTANATLSTAQLAAHTHSGGSGGRATANSEQTDAANMNTGSAGSGQGHSHNMSANFSGNFAGSANSVLQPYLTLIYIIKT